MSKIIIMNNKFSKLEESDMKFLAALDSHLSFKVEGAEYTISFKLHHWDGVQKILTTKLHFPNGLLLRVENFYKLWNKPYIIEDKRENKTQSNPVDILQNLKKLNIEPFYYQNDALAITDVEDRGIFKLPTGSGKSLLIAMIAAKLGKITNIYVISKSLLYQFHEDFSRFFSEKIGIIGDGKCDIQRINICSIWTLAQAVGLKEKDLFIDGEETEKEKLDLTKKSQMLDLMKNSKVHIFDECHICATETIKQIYKSINPEYIYGFSGTPFKTGGSDLLIEGILGRNIVDISATELINKGFLVKPVIRFVNVPKIIGGLPRNWHTVYKQYIVENPIRNQLICDNTISLVEKGYQTLVLFSNIRHGKMIHEMLKDKVKCAILYGDDSMETRNEVKQKVLNKELDCVICSTIFDIGISWNSLSGLVLCGGGKSYVKAMQRIGRIVRNHPGKKRAAVVDFNDDAPFLKEHSKKRMEIYKLEEGFDVGVKK